MKEDARTIGLILKRLRESHDISVSQLARLAGKDKSYISRIENGKKSCSHKVQLKILELFSKDYKWLVNEVSKRRNDYLFPERIIPDFSRLNDQAWLKELTVDKPYYEKSYYKKKSEEYWNKQETKSDLPYKKALVLYKRKLSLKHATLFFEDHLNPLIEKNYFKTSLIIELTQVYTEVMTAYESSEWNRRLILLKDLNKFLSNLGDYDLAVGKDDILLSLKDFKIKNHYYMKKVLNSSELKFVEHIHDGRGRPSKKEKMFNRNEYIEYSISDDEVDFEIAEDLNININDQLKPEYFHQLLFLNFYKVIKENAIIKYSKEKREHLISVGLLISGQLCIHLSMPLLPDINKESLVSEINLQDLNFDRFTSEDDANLPVLRKDHPDFKELIPKLKSILGQYQKLFPSVK